MWSKLLLEILSLCVNQIFSICNLCMFLEKKSLSILTVLIYFVSENSFALLIFQFIASKLLSSINKAHFLND